MTQELITVKQLPIIEERLQLISEEVQAQTAAALALDVTEDTVKQVKKERAELNKSFKALEEQRKAVKNAVMAPYMKFEEAYKRYVTDIFTSADKQLKTRIDEVEQALLQNKRNEVIAHFNEATAVRGIDFLTFDRLGIKVLLTDSTKKLCEQVDAKLDKIADDLSAITTTEYPEEALVEYKDKLDLANAIMAVKTRHERIAAELKRKEEEQQKQTEMMSLGITKSAQSEPALTSCSNTKPYSEYNSISAQFLPVKIIVMANSPDDVQKIKEFCDANQFEYTVYKRSDN